ncbi:MAG: tyrosine-type recombinase/integrase, partial [Rhodospirillales bacterium]|nr:tyrosine-type recombinase/integrase [Rhodospirillales bacterium]
TESPRCGRLNPTRPWLRAAVTIALETCMRQAELAGLTWDRIRLDVLYPYPDLPKTKNDRARRVPLSLRAVEAFVSLRPEGAIAVIGKCPVLPVETGRGIAHAFRDAVTDDKFSNLRWHAYGTRPSAGCSRTLTCETTRSWPSADTCARRCWPDTPTSEAIDLE